MWDNLFCPPGGFHKEKSKLICILGISSSKTAKDDAGVMDLADSPDLSIKISKIADSCFFINNALLKICSIEIAKINIQDVYKRQK